MVRKDGEVILTTISVKRVHRDDRSVDYFVALLHDVTDARQSKLAAAHLAAIVESSEDAIISKDLNGVIQSWNLGATQIFGYSATEAVGQHIGLIVPEERRAEEEAALTRVREGRASSRHLARRLPDPGRERDGHRRVEDRPGQHRRLEAQQAALLGREQKVLAEAKAANQAQDEFLAILSHELRNPLAAIMTGSDLLRRVAPDSPTAHETRTVVGRQVALLARPVDDLLDVSRISAGRIVLRLESLDLRDVIHDAIETTRPNVEAHGGLAGRRARRAGTRQRLRRSPAAGRSPARPS